MKVFTEIDPLQWRGRERNRRPIPDGKPDLFAPQRNETESLAWFKKGWDGVTVSTEGAEPRGGRAGAGEGDLDGRF